MRDIVARYRGRAEKFALKLDVEGWEFAILDALTAQPELLCALDYLFVEYHNLKFNATKYGLPEDVYHRIGGKIQKAMDEVPGCRLRIHWRSFWSACGEPMRFVWSGSYQATNVNASTNGKGGRGARRRGRRRVKSR